MTDSIQPFGTPSPTGPVLPEAFDQFVGDTFFRQMLKSMRASIGKPAYFHGGQAEEIFQSQLDEILISDLAKATGDSLSADLFKRQFPNHTSQTPPGQVSPSNIPSPPGNTAQSTLSFDADA